MPSTWSPTHVTSLPVSFLSPDSLQNKGSQPHVTHLIPMPTPTYNWNCSLVKGHGQTPWGQFQGVFSVLILDSFTKADCIIVQEYLLSLLLDLSLWEKDIPDPSGCSLTMRPALAVKCERMWPVVPLWPVPFLGRISKGYHHCLFLVLYW